MSWVIAGMAAIGVMQGAANQKKMKRQNEYRAEAIRYSPWTGMGDPGVQQLPGALEMGLKGAAMGATMGGSGGAAGATPAQQPGMFSQFPGQQDLMIQNGMQDASLYGPYSGMPTA